MPLSRGSKRGMIIGVVGLAGAIVYFGLLRPTPIKVTVKPVAYGPVQTTISNTRTGTVKTCQRAQMSPSIGGKIDKLLVKEGDRVKQGDLLLELWNEDLRAELRLAERDSIAAKAKVQEACVMAEVAEQEAGRLTQLHSKGLVSEENAQRATGEARARRASCEAAHATVQSSLSRLDVIHAQIERTRLRAPFTGTVAEINGEIGEFVTPSPVGVLTLPTLDLIDTRCLYVLAPIDEVDAPRINDTMPSFIVLDAFTKQRFPGKIRRIANYVLDREKQARTIDIEVEFINAEQLPNLLPGYSADIEVVLEQRERSLRIPSEAVQEGGTVYVLDRDGGILQKRSVQIGLKNWQYTEVLSGVEEGEQVVTSPEREGVNDGARAVVDTAS